MALLDSKQLSPRFTGSVTLSGSFHGDSNSSASFKQINSPTASIGRLNVTGQSDFTGGPISFTGGPTSIVSTTTLSAKGNTGASFGDDTGTWEFNGSGAVSETGMTTFSLTPGSAVDIDAGGAITIDGAEITLGGDGDTGDVILS